jgi:cytochrome c-type biogenesis protein CcmH/NrfF
VRRAAALALALLLLSPAAAVAQQCPKTSLVDIEDEVMCLQCGVPLSLSEQAPAARRQRAFIQEQVDACKSKAEIKDMLVAQFGDRVLAQPDSTGAWLVPAAAIGGGLLLAGAAAYQWRRRRAPAPQSPALGAEDDARLRRDMERYDV